MHTVHSFTDRRTGALTVIRRTTPRRGVLIVTDHDGHELGRRDVTISYDAIFGPDVADVPDWERVACEIIDGVTS